MEFIVQKYVLIFIAAFLLHFVIAFHHDIPCEPKFFTNQSCVCVCNETYCDTISRESPLPGNAVVYTSSEAGQRFKKTGFKIVPDEWSISSKMPYLELHPETTYQTVEGFGGAITDSAGINWRALNSERLKQNLIDSYCSDSGLEYNIIRLPIGGTDFSTRAYTYNDLPEHDVGLTNFTLAFEDFQYKIPMVQACQKAANSSALKFLATSWSPPAWMKSNGNITGYSRLKKEYYQAYADYHCKFVKAYEEQQIPIWAITTTNEPINGVMNLASFNSLGWTIHEMGEWIEKNLGPTMHEKCPGVKIIGVDDQRFLLPLFFNLMVQSYPGALEYLDGAAVHYYTDQYVPASLLKTAMEPYPGKFVIATEASEGALNPIGVDRVVIGSWERAENYVKDIIEDMINDVVGWIDWNLCLNTQGGPNWVENNVDSPVIVDAEKGEFYKQPMFYAIGHFSKFVPRGSKRIKVTEKWDCGEKIMNVAFLTPENTVVVVMYNSKEVEQVAALKLGDNWVYVTVGAKAIVTVELPQENLNL